MRLGACLGGTLVYSTIIRLGYGCNCLSRLLGKRLKSEYRFKNLVGATPRAGTVILCRQLGTLYQTYFYLKTLIMALAIDLVTIVAQLDDIVNKLG
jgi:hypothetical protein